MKKIILLLKIMLFSLIGYSQCPIPSVCTYTATSGVNYTVNAGETLCIKAPTNYSSGTITLNGGTLYVENGATLSTNVSTNSSSMINTCGTLNTTFTQSNLIVNNYTSNTTISFVIDNGVKFNNFASNVTLNVNSGNPNNPVNITNSANGSLTVVTNTNNSNCSQSLGTSTNITNDGTIIFPNSLCMKGGLITNNKNMTFNSQLAMDGGTIESKIGSNTSINTLRKNNGNINVYNGSILSVSNIINYDGNPIKMMDAGCSYVTLATPPSSSFNNNFTDNGVNVYPNGINYCGGVARNSSASGNTILSVVNSFGTYRITLTNGNNAPNTGDYVYITGVVGGTLNGYWKVTRIGSTNVYDLVSSAYSPITSLSSNFIYTNGLRMGNATYMGESGCSNPCVPLPVVFTYFNINKNSENSCIISYGINIPYKECVIQSSLDGRNFTDIYTTANNSNNVTYTAYGSGVLYYRIKCVENNDNIIYSQLKVNQNNEYSIIETYPNPTNDGIINITWNHLNTVDIDSEITIIIYDINGNVIKNINLTDYEDNNMLIELPKGIFILKIYGNSIYKTFKIISL